MGLILVYLLDLKGNFVVHNFVMNNKTTKMMMITIYVSIHQMIVLQEANKQLVVFTFLL